MTASEIAKAVMKVTGMSQLSVAEKAGLAGQSTVGMFLKSKSMRVDNFDTILRTCGYELVARDPSGRLPEFVIGEQHEAHTSDNNADMEEMIRRIVAEELRKVGTTPASDE